MSKALFTKDENAKTITVERSFAAPRHRVWQAWTEKDTLEKWWAPKPWKAIVREMDFRKGGHCLYYMQGPDGTKQWCWVGYESITPEESFTLQDAFCDEEGNINKDMPSMHWQVEFHDEGENTKVLVTITFEKAEDMKKIIEMGFEEGFSMGLGNLDEVLAS